MTKQEKVLELTDRRDKFTESITFLLSELDEIITFEEHITEQEWFADKESILTELESSRLYLNRQLEEENKEAKKLLENIKEFKKEK